ncbi:hypothetical protein AMECASPLE_028871 [Ameca splendens]|uniref:Uncharacterized protein n=1 Tax=Ameca splendens TaxID=208324 RepID=A0ABV0YSP4_9TELE
MHFAKCCKYQETMGASRGVKVYLNSMECNHRFLVIFRETKVTEEVEQFMIKNLFSHESLCKCVLPEHLDILHAQLSPISPQESIKAGGVFAHLCLFVYIYFFPRERQWSGVTQ